MSAPRPVWLVYLLAMLFLVGALLVMLSVLDTMRWGP